MNYKLYTTVDITHTKQYRIEIGKEQLYWKEQNFNTVLQTLGLRANISYGTSPILIEIKGSLLGFTTDNIIRVWRFDFYTATENVYQKDTNPTGLLLEDFEMVPFIGGLDEPMTQNYNVFVTFGSNKNIVFFQK